MSVFSTADICHPKRHFFDLTYTNKFTFDMGQLIPFCWQDVVPNDKVKIGVQTAIRFQPLVAPFMHSVYLYTHWFFVPSRILFKDTDAEGMDKDKMFFNWLHNYTEDGVEEFSIELPKLTTAPLDFSVARYMGYPLTMPTITENSKFQGYVSLPIRAYNKIYNDFYRDENLIDEVDLDNNNILLSAYKKDYFTSALLDQQRGDPPQLKFYFPDSPVVLNMPSGASYAHFRTETSAAPIPRYRAIYSSDNSTTLKYDDFDDPLFNGEYLGKNSEGKKVPFAQSSEASGSKNVLWSDNSQLSASFDASDLRLLMQVQKWQERNMRCGNLRYNEYLKSHYGICPTDETLQRPQYIGGSKSVCRVSEIPQTSESGTTKQGTLAGKATIADTGYIGTYTVKEFGYIIGICKVVPELAYMAQGARRHLINYSKFDYYAPEFANLSERPVYDVELYAGASDPFHIFGYQAQWNEMRSNQSQAVCGMDDAFAHWNLNRKFGNTPILNQDFIECDGTQTTGLKRIFAVPSQKGLVGTFVNNLYLYRPLPKFSQPGLIDHTYGG